MSHTRRNNTEPNVDCRNEDDVWSAGEWRMSCRRSDSRLQHIGDSLFGRRCACRCLQWSARIQWDDPLHEWVRDDLSGQSRNCDRKVKVLKRGIIESVEREIFTEQPELQTIASTMTSLRTVPIVVEWCRAMSNRWHIRTGFVLKTIIHLYFWKSKKRQTIMFSIREISNGRMCCDNGRDTIRISLKKWITNKIHKQSHTTTTGRNNFSNRQSQYVVRVQHSHPIDTYRYSNRFADIHDAMRSVRLRCIFRQIHEMEYRSENGIHILWEPQ